MTIRSAPVQNDTSNTEDFVSELRKHIDQATIDKYLLYLSRHELLSDPNPSITDQAGSVLGHDDIMSLCEATIPLVAFPNDESETKLKIEAASYQLRLGSRCRVVDENGNNNIKWLSDSQKVLRIPPHGIAIVTTYEWVNIPGYLIGRWNLKVKKVYEGLVWVGSLQVDPGYQGFLSCPIYNLSSEFRELIYKDPLFTIDFVKTTPCSNGKYSIWKLPSDRYSTFGFGRLDDKNIKSAPQESFIKIDNQLLNFKQEAKQSKTELENKMEHNFEINLILLGILFTAIGIIAGFGLGSVHWDEDWMIPVMAGFALVLSALAVVISFRARKTRSKSPPNSQEMPSNSSPKQ